MAGAVTGGIYQSMKNIKSMEQPERHELKIDNSFSLKEHDGHLALYRGDAESPYQVLDYLTVFLNDYDRELVSGGIVVSTEKEMKILIEDLTG